MVKRIAKASGYGLTVALIIIIMTALILAGLLRFTGISEAQVAWLPAASAVAALGIAGIIAGAKMKEKGLFAGAMTGLVYCLFILGLGFLGFDASPTLHQLLLSLGEVGAAALGGIIGVNLTGTIRS